MEEQQPEELWLKKAKTLAKLTEADGARRGHWLQNLQGAPDEKWDPSQNSQKGEI
jgi:hypothetical protein